MRIDNLPAALLRSMAGAAPRQHAAFLPGEELPPAPAAPVAGQPAGPVPSVAMLVTLAATQDDVERRRRRAEEAERGLDALEGLHRELLAGAVSPARLAEIAAWSRDHEASEEPAIAALLAQIDLRVRVELAKFDIEA